MMLLVVPPVVVYHRFFFVDKGLGVVTNLLIEERENKDRRPVFFLLI